MSENGDFVNVQGGRIYYESSGAGPALVLVHAAIADRRMWDREYVEYSRDRTVVRYDLRGLGRSTAATAPYRDVDDLLALLDRLSIRTATMVGCSNGGKIATDFALTHPERVDRLVLVAPSLGGYELSGDPEEAAVFQRCDERFSPIVAAFRAGDRESALKGVREFWCAAQHGPALNLVVQMLRDNLDEIFTDASARHATALDPHAASRLASISAPTLVLHGDRDAEDSRFFAERVATGIPGAERRIIPGADHLVNLSKPEEFDAAVREFLARPA
jgi:3-oxoadipate enol-lactonase